MNIVLYGKITGAHIATADYDWMQDTLGMEDENDCNKLKLETEKVRNSCLQETSVFSWGNNHVGQCGTSSKVRLISKP